MSSSHQKNDIPTPIIIWCVPRSCSTATERAFMQRKDTRSYHEPLSMPFYFGKDRPCRRYDDKRCQADESSYNSTIEGTLKALLEEKNYNSNLAKGKEACQYIFIKDMAQYIFPAQTLKALHPNSTVYKSNAGGATLPGPLDNPTVLPINLLRRFKHTFLIRTPQKSIPSYWKCVQEKAAGFEYFDGAEAGFAELKILYDWMSNPKSTFHTASEDDDQHQKWPGQIQAQPQPPPLIDASVLLANPDHVLSEYCSALGIPFDQAMLSWESGPVEEFAAWGTYHNAAENSTGFKKETPIDKEAEDAGKRVSHSGGGLSDTASSEADTETEADNRAKSKAKKQMPDEVLETISSTMDAYNYLFARRTIKPPAKK